MTLHDPHVAVGCFIRSSAAVKSVDGAIRTLHEYDTEGTVNEVSTGVWPDIVKLTDETADSTALEQYERFRTWADDNGVSLAPAFTKREWTNRLTGESDTIVRLPVLCLAIYIDDECVSVAPHSTGTDVYTVKDALNDIDTLPRVREASEIPGFSVGDTVRTATTSEAEAEAESDEPTHEERTTRQ